MRPRLRACLATILAGAVAMSGAPGSAQAPPLPPPEAAIPAAPPVVASSPVANPLASSPARRARAARPRLPGAAPAAIAATAPVAAPSLQPQRPGARLAPGMPIPPAELEAFVDGVVREAMAGDHIAGATVSIVQNGQLALKKGYGYASLSPARPMDPDRTLVRLGSISKTFTWIALMKQVERGRMGVGNPVNQYVPQRLQIRDQGFTKPITLRDLMTHSAGFEDRALGHLFEEDPDRIRPLNAYLRREAPDRVREAGGLPVYSNYGAALAGEAIAEVANQPFARLIEMDILIPLHMGRTTFREPYPARPELPQPMTAAMARDLSQGFRWSGGALEPRKFEYLTQIAPAGSASSTASDMARYMTMILNGGSLEGAVVYSPATAQAFRTVQLRASPEVTGWAHGFKEYRLPGGFTGFGHEGQTLSFRSNMVTVPDLGLGVFVSANTETGLALSQRLPQLIVERFYGGPRMLPAVSRSFSPNAFAGVYWTERRAYSGLEKFVSLFSGRAVAKPTRDGRLAILSGDGARTWTPSGADGRFQAADGPEVSAFEMQNGKAVRWYAAWGGESFKRAGVLSRMETVAFLGILALIAAIATLIGLSMRDRRDFRQTSIQSRASAVQTATAVLWLIAMLGFWAWGASAGSDVARAVYDWPGPWLVIASACALIAAILALVDALLLPAIWRGGRRLDSWTVMRKLRFTATALIFLSLSVVLLVNGALEPWSG